MSFNVFNLSELQSVFRGVFDNYEEHLASLDERIDNAFLKKTVVTDDELADRLNKFHGDSSSVHSGLRRRNGEARRLLFMFFPAYRPRLAASSTASS